MRRSFRRQLWLLRACVVATSLALVVLSAAAFRSQSATPSGLPQNPAEITVERIES